jgi:TRAP-type uncharacterized transport system substrate-binding protein
MEHREVSGNEARAVMLTQIGLALMHGRQARDVCVVLGNGAGASFEPGLKIATGLIGLAHAVARGDIDAAFVNPSALLAQAYRGTGLFKEPLPVRTLATYPSWDRFVCAVQPKTGISSLQDLKDKRYPLRVSIREDPTHGTRLLLDDALAGAGFSLEDIERWGGEISYAKRPRDEDRLHQLRDGEIEAIFDEGVQSWFEEGLKYGLRPIDLGEAALQRLESVGWRRAILPASRFPALDRDCTGVDFSGWVLYCRESLPDDDAARILEAVAEREDEMPWEQGTYQGLAHLGQDTDSTPRPVPLHPGAERWYRGRGFSV